MPLELNFICPLRNGFHARPASALEEVVRGLDSEVLLTNERTSLTVDARSVLALLAADIRHGDRCHLRLSGPDELIARARLEAFLTQELPHCDDEEAPVATEQEAPIPRSLRATISVIHRGTPAAPGVGRGRVVCVRGLRLPEAETHDGPIDPAGELKKLDAALSALQEDYAVRIQRRASRVETELLGAHGSIVRDRGFRERLQEAVKQGRTIASAIKEVEAHFTRLFSASQSALLRERALDIKDVCFDLFRHAYGQAAAGQAVSLVEDSIVIARSLTPEQLLALDRRFLKGLAVEHAGTTSHTVILARSFGIPTVTGVTSLGAIPEPVPEGAIDGDLGWLVTDLDEVAERYFAAEASRREKRRERERELILQPAATGDGHLLEIGANISSAEEAVAAFANGAQGIGLFRTEMLFLDRKAPPQEDEQFEVYRKTLATAAGRPVIIRTFDVGGDKPLPYLRLEPEDNPFLGFRAVRLYQQFEHLFRTQLRALVRASAHGALRVMFPMIAGVAEVRWVRQVLADEQSRCARDGIAFDRAMPVGAMVEVPSAAFVIDQLAPEIDFFSIGSNDLLQCFVAADRGNSRVAKYYDPLQPAFLRLLKKIADDARAAGKWVGLCGEMGGRTECLPFLTGLGLDEISASVSSIPALKLELTGWSISACRKVATKALQCTTADEVRRLLDDRPAPTARPLLEPDLMLLDSISTTKEEAIKELTDQLYVLGRTNQPHEIEEAVWQREASYSTGFGDGFAIPHCQTNRVAANSLAVLKLRTPVAWGSLDNQPVRVVILLAIRNDAGAGEHLKVLSRLARLLMHEEFRDSIEKADDPVELCARLKEKLEA